MSGNTLFSRVESVLEELRPFFHADGGDVRLVGVDLATGIVRVFMVGACQGCPSATATLQHGVLIRLQEAIPEITDVVPVARIGPSVSGRDFTGGSSLLHEPR